ncbi:MAG TPA: polyprenol phosphomannose-dependent alpha 1,6 mannosyltransferase MptB [Pilimelia sp.]|nr:polyprenol phosphomannose-dependent alpha 1,6 mannosyltransferase MptB [Pilimelia sp.]
MRGGAVGRGAAVLRYAGLFGASLLAAGAYRAGALPGSAAASGVRTGALADPGYAAAFVACGLGLVLLAVAWWRLGAVLRDQAGHPKARAAPHAPPKARAAISLRWVLVTGVLWAVPLLVAPPLGSRDVYAYACQGWLWADGRDPYGGGVASGGCPWLDAVPALWHDTPAPYGPLGILLPGSAAWLATHLPLAESQQLFVTVGLLRLLAVAGAALVAWQGVGLARRCGVRPAAAAWLGVVTPLAALHVVSGAHHDAIIAGLLVAALAAAVRRGWAPAVGAGALIGLAAAVKITALVALPFAVLLVARDRRVPALARGLGAVAGSAVAAFAALTVAAGLGLGWAGALTGTSELKQWTSPPTGVGMAAGYLLRAAGWPGGYDAAIGVARAAGLLALVAVLVALWVRAARAPGDPARAVVGCGWALAAVVLLSPVAYPWYALVPVAVLAVAEPREQVRHWLAVAVLVASFLVLPDGLGVAVLTKLPGAVAVAALTGLAAWLAVRYRLALRRRRAGIASAVTRPTDATAPPGPGR